MTEELTPMGPAVDKIIGKLGNRKKTLTSLEKKFVAGENVLNGTGNSPYIEYLLKIIFPQLIEGNHDVIVIEDQKNSLDLFLTNHEGLALAMALQKLRTDVSNSKNDNKEDIVREINKILRKLIFKEFKLEIVEGLKLKHSVLDEEEINPSE